MHFVVSPISVSVLLASWIVFRSIAQDGSGVYGFNDWRGLVESSQHELGTGIGV